MRGNHRLWGRQDYCEPPALNPAALAGVRLCTVRPRWADRAQRHNWHEVRLDGQLLGYVTTRMAGQFWRTEDMDGWIPAASDWNRTDPDHAHAILRLLEDASLGPRPNGDENDK